MRRVEIIGNHSLEQELLDDVKLMLPELCWTMVPDVHGKGFSGLKLGDGVWPETNFQFFSYCTPQDETKLRYIVQNITKRYPSEGIVIFSTEAFG